MASKRFQARRWSGRFTRNTPENTMGLHIAICPACNRLNPYPVSEPKPEKCHTCGAPLAALHCTDCGEPHLSETCKGNDSNCIEGPNGEPRNACPKWEPYCCKCGPAWALGQI